MPAQSFAWVTMESELNLDVADRDKLKGICFKHFETCLAGNTSRQSRLITQPIFDKIMEEYKAFEEFKDDKEGRVLVCKHLALLMSKWKSSKIPKSSKRGKSEDGVDDGSLKTEKIKRVIQGTPKRREDASPKLKSEDVRVSPQRSGGTFRMLESEDVQSATEQRGDISAILEMGPIQSASRRGGDTLQMREETVLHKVDASSKQATSSVRNETNRWDMGHSGKDFGGRIIGELRATPSGVDSGDYSNTPALHRPIDKSNSQQLREKIPTRKLPSIGSTSASLTPRAEIIPTTACSHSQQQMSLALPFTSTVRLENMTPMALHSKDSNVLLQPRQAIHNRRRLARYSHLPTSSRQEIPMTGISKETGTASGGKRVNNTILANLQYKRRVASKSTEHSGDTSSVTMKSFR